MGKIKCHRVIIEGVTSYAIQGVNLREKAEQFVRTELDRRGKIRGKISNLKNGQVEIIFSGKKSDLKRMSDYLKQEVKAIKRIETYGIEVDSNSLFDFAIERSDDLSEMVWALRGAGSRFKEAADALEKIDKTLQERDKKTAIGRLLATHFELVRNRDLIAGAQKKIPMETREKITLVALESNIENPAIPKIDFVYLLTDVYSGLADFIANIQPDVKDLSNKVDRLLKMIKGELYNRGLRI